MKVTSSILLSALCCAGEAAAAGRVFIREAGGLQRTVAQRHGRTISPEAARVVLAQRVGVERHHVGTAEKEEMVDAINDFGLRSSLFGKAAVPREQRVLLVEVPDEGEEAFVQRYSDKATSGFSISTPPSTSSTTDLLNDIIAQVEAIHSRADRLAHEHHSSIEAFESAWNEATGKDSVDVIVITTSSSTAGDNTWATYTMPHSHLHKRATSERTVSKRLPNLGLLAASSKPLPGILPSCFPSQSACEETTRNCTGHGSCALAYSDPSAPNAAKNKNCYSCSCKATTAETSSGKTKTTYWGGPACQKKDVSVQFWLIALFVVAMAGLVAFAVGSVWSMGEEDLPSVIGAGVSGPTARR